MLRCIVRPLLLLLLSTLAASAVEPLAVEIDLSAQKALLLQDGKVVYESPISTGRPKYPTPTGHFQIIEKDAEHRSSLYGKIVGGDGKVVVRDADSDMPVPPGAKFVNAPMKNFMRFDGATGMHEGVLPGYPASHGCVRMPPLKAKLFFDILEIGTPVRVHGKAPTTTPPERPPRATPTPPPTPEPRKWWQFIRRVTPTPMPVRPAIPIAPRSE